MKVKIFLLRVRSYPLKISKIAKNRNFWNLTLGAVSGPNFAPEVEFDTQKISKLKYEALIAKLKMVIFDFL